MKKIKINQIYIIKDIISNKNLNIIQNELNNTKWNDGIGGDPNQHCNSLSQITQEILINTQKIVIQNIEEDFKTKIGPESPGTVVKYVKGWELRLHYDQLDNLPTYAGYPRRDFSSIIYLTENFSGGNLHFPKLNINIEPFAGSVIYFPGTEDYLHEVTKLINGDRITITNFWCSLNN